MDIDEKILELIKEEPRTPTEIANILGMNHVSVIKRLLKMQIRDKRIRSKKIGRYEIFWYSTHEEN